MAEFTTVHVEGLPELHKALKRADVTLKRELDKALREAGKVVAMRARSLLDTNPNRHYSAMGIRPRVKGFGAVRIEESRKRTTGQHPTFGALIMRKSLIPAATELWPATVKSIEMTLERLATEFDQ